MRIPVFIHLLNLGFLCFSATMYFSLRLGTKSDREKVSAMDQENANKEQELKKLKVVDEQIESALACKSALEGLATLIPDRDLSLRVVDAIHTRLPDNGQGADNRKIWILRLELAAAAAPDGKASAALPGGEPPYPTDWQLTVALTAGITHRDPPEARKFLTDQLGAPIAKEFKLGNAGQDWDVSYEAMIADLAPNLPSDLKGGFDRLKLYWKIKVGPENFVNAKEVGDLKQKFKELSGAAGSKPTANLPEAQELVAKTTTAIHELSAFYEANDLPLETWITGAPPAQVPANGAFDAKYMTLQGDLEKRIHTALGPNGLGYDRAPGNGGFVWDARNPAIPDHKATLNKRCRIQERICNAFESFNLKLPPSPSKIKMEEVYFPGQATNRPSAGSAVAFPLWGGALPATALPSVTLPGTNPPMTAPVGSLIPFGVVARMHYADVYKLVAAVELIDTEPKMLVRLRAMRAEVVMPLPEMIPITYPQGSPRPSFKPEDVFAMSKYYEPIRVVLVFDVFDFDSDLMTKMQQITGEGLGHVPSEYHFNIQIAKIDPVPGGIWACLRAPSFEYKEKATLPTEGPSFTSRVLPEVLEAKADVGGVTLFWSDRAVILDQKTKAETPFNVAGYTLERKAKDKWEKVADLPADKKSHFDTTVLPKSAYAYRVIAHLNDERLKEPNAVTPPSNEVKVQTLGSIGIKFVKVLSTVVDGQPTVAGSVTIRKFIEGEWIERSMTVKKGDKIDPPPFNHRINGKMEKIDLSTGFTVLDIDHAKVKNQRRIRVQKKGPDGRPIPGEFIDETQESEIPTTKLIYKDGEGRTQEIYVE